MLSKKPPRVETFRISVLILVKRRVLVYYNIDELYPLIKEGGKAMTPEERARELIDKRLEQSGWVIQDMRQVNPMASLGVAVREYPTSTGPVDYALFVDGIPVGVIEAKKDDLGENITVVEGQSGRYANSTFKYITAEYKIRFAYEATGQLTRFTDYDDIKYRSRRVFSFHRPETLLALLAKDDTMKKALRKLIRKAI